MRNNPLYQKFRTAVLAGSCTLDGVKLLSQQQVRELAEADNSYTVTFLDNMKQLLVDELQQDSDISEADFVKSKLQPDFPDAHDNPRVWHAWLWIRVSWPWPGTPHSSPCPDNPKVRQRPR